MPSAEQEANQRCHKSFSCSALMLSSTTGSQSNKAAPANRDWYSWVDVATAHSYHQSCRLDSEQLAIAPIDWRCTPGTPGGPGPHPTLPPVHPPPYQP